MVSVPHGSLEEVVERALKTLVKNCAQSGLAPSTETPAESVGDMLPNRKGLKLDGIRIKDL
jgi:hypothetical protein